MDNLKRIGIVKMSRIQAVLNALERHNHDGIDMDISFEYILGSCFPMVYDNVLDRMKSEYTRGYIQGINENQNLTRQEKDDIINKKMNRNIN